MSAVRFYLDEDCQSAALVNALRHHGIDVTTANDAAMRGADDETQLLRAVAQGAVLVSHNAADFAKLHVLFRQSERSHAGIVLYAQQTFSIGEVARRLLRLWREIPAEAMRDRLEWLTAWPTVRSA